MNIVFVCSEFPWNKDSSTGGFGRYVSVISKALSNQGHEVVVICKGSRALHQSYGPRLEVVSVAPAGKRLIDSIRAYIQIPLIQRLLNFLEYPVLWSWAVRETLTKIKKKTSLDIIEGGDFGGELFFYLMLTDKTVPVVIKLHTPSYLIRDYNSEKSNLFYAIIDVLEIYCLKHADFIYAPSKAIAKQVSQRIKRTVEMIIPYPVAISLWSRNRKTKNLILYAGKLQPKKGVFILLQAVHLLRKRLGGMQVLLVGPDTIWNGKSVKDQLATSIQELKLSHLVKMKNAVSTKEMLGFYRRAVVTVVPSLWENFPNVCLEAMANGSLVVASRVGGIIEIVKHHSNGILFSPGDPENLAKALKNGLDDVALRSKMVGKAQEIVKKRFNPARIAKQTIAYYESCKRF